MTSLSDAAQKRVDDWLSGPFDEGTKEEIKKLQKTDPKLLQDAFFETLSFGTGGMRGVMGVGTARLNIYTIRQATKGLANYLLKAGKQPLRVAICYDCRHNSKEFALEAASVFAACGIEVHIARELRPTPFASFICREKKCDAAVMITASHNPPEYNGYKVFWSDGAQVVSPHAEGIIEEVEAVSNLAEIPVERENGLIHFMTEEDDHRFIAAMAEEQRCKDLNQERGKELNIVYTSLHGAGITLMEKALRYWHFTSYRSVAAQITPDPNFSTVDAPNPQESASLKLGEETLLSTNSDILIANDPDADRVGCVLLHKGKPVMLTGNEIAVLLLHHLLQHRDKLPDKGAVVASIVTTRLLQKLAEKNGLAYFNVLTGFKYIGEKIHQWEESGRYNFVFGAEQSHGYLTSIACRDKDGITINCLLCELALKAKTEGKTLIDLLHEIYVEYGVYLEAEKSFSFKLGEEGKIQMEEVMEKLRGTPPEKIGDLTVTQRVDYRNGIDGLPRTNMVSLHLEDGSYLIVRPSGTEPKMKIYAFTNRPVEGTVCETLAACRTYLQELFSFYDSL